MQREADQVPALEKVVPAHATERKSPSAWIWELR